MISYIVFGFAHGTITLIGMLVGMKTNKKNKVERGIIGGLAGHALGEGAAGLVALNIPLALGAFTGCVLSLIIYLIYRKVTLK